MWYWVFIVIISWMIIICRVVVLMCVLLMRLYSNNYISQKIVAEIYNPHLFNITNLGIVLSLLYHFLNSLIYFLDIHVNLTLKLLLLSHYLYKGVDITFEQTYHFIYYVFWVFITQFLHIILLYN